METKRNFYQTKLTIHKNSQTTPPFSLIPVIHLLFDWLLAFAGNVGGGIEDDATCTWVAELRTTPHAHGWRN
jgi:hypothetical protein